MPLVYIADDEPHIRRLAAIGLKDAGFETAEFSDGAVLLHAVQQRQPDAVLLDWMMPGQDGLEVLRAMRENPITRPIPILMMTARTDEADRVRLGWSWERTIMSPSRSASRSWPPGCGPLSGGRVSDRAGRPDADGLRYLHRRVPPPRVQERGSGRADPSGSSICCIP